MAIDVIVPEVGEVGMEVTLVHWLKDEGDEVRSGDVLFEVDTEKSIVAVEAYTDGTLADLLVQEGELVTPHQVVARILAPGEVFTARVPEPSIYDPNWSPSAGGDATDAGEETHAVWTGARSRNPISKASPRARDLAAEAGVDLTQVASTGPGGLITARDIQAAISVSDMATAAALTAGKASAAVRAERVRRAVAEVTTSSWLTVPHFYLELLADVTRALEYAQPTPLLLVAVARALLRHPECNVGWQGELPVERKTIDIGLLVDTPDGLMLATIREADGLGLADMREAVAATVGRARAGVLEAGDLAPRSLTVSNLGMYAVDRFSSIIRSPDTMSLAVGRVRTVPRWDGVSWSPARALPLTLSVDHRALDGASAARLLTTLETILAGNEGALQ